MSFVSDNVAVGKWLCLVLLRQFGALSDLKMFSYGKRWGTEEVRYIGEVKIKVYFENREDVDNSQHRAASNN